MSRGVHIRTHPPPPLAGEGTSMILSGGKIWKGKEKKGKHDKKWRKDNNG
jgi:hypothetical protein